jgi:hypothetical protein
MDMQLDYTMYFVELVDNAILSNEALNTILEKLSSVNVYSEWIFGLNVAIFALLIVIIFAIFFTNYK